jgi:hypothetical protein
MQISNLHFAICILQFPDVACPYPPAMAPMMKKGSFPDAIASGSGASGDS